MKINDMTISDRFDDLLEKVVLIKSSLEDQLEDEEPRLRPSINSLETLFKRLTNLKDHVLNDEA